MDSKVSTPPPLYNQSLLLTEQEGPESRNHAAQLRATLSERQVTARVYERRQRQRAEAHRSDTSLSSPAWTRARSKARCRATVATTAQQ